MSGRAGVIRVACSPGERRIAVWQEGALRDYAIWRPGAPDGVGDLHRARLLAPMPGLGGAFVALATGEAFLADRAALAFPEGQSLRVRVVRAAQGGKGPRVLLLGPAEPGPPALLEPGPSPLLALATRYPAAELHLDDPALVPVLRPALGARLCLVRRAWDEATEEAVAALAAPVLALPGGVRLCITPTPALTAIDIDWGGAGGRSAGPAGKPTAQMAANQALLPALAAQIRLRNLGGAILVDFAGLPARKRAALGPPLAEALAGDPLRPRLLGFTALGLAEIVRPRERPPLYEVLRGPHAAGLAALRRLAAVATANPARRLALRAAPAVVAALEADPVALPALAARRGHPLLLQSDPALGAEDAIEESA